MSVFKCISEHTTYLTSDALVSIIVSVPQFEYHVGVGIVGGATYMIIVYMYIAS